MAAKALAGPDFPGSAAPPGPALRGWTEGRQGAIVCPLRPPGRGSDSWSSKGIGFRHGDEHRHPAVYLAARRVGRARPAGHTQLPRHGWRTAPKGLARQRIAEGHSLSIRLEHGGCRAITKHN